MVIQVSPRRVTLMLMAGIALIVVVNVAAGINQWATGTEVPEYIDVADEPSVPTWYSTGLLLMASALLFVIARAKRMTGDRWRRHWLGLAWVVLYMSVDEITSFHNYLNQLVPDWMAETGPFSGAWIARHLWLIPGTILVLVVAAVFLRFVVRLPPVTRNLFLLAGATFVAGSIGGEAIEGWFAARYGGGILTASTTLLEETLELVGVVILIYALLRHLAVIEPEIVFRIGGPE